ncbi:MAG: carbohydrate kinase [Desulfovibrionaceae bacterium]|nr:carbohydrate kinase [Desulfovibrionaceae bacterium]
MDFANFKDLKIRCAGLGEVLFDVFPNGMKLGGAPANFAYHCTQLGFESLIVSAVGMDENGEKARNILALNYMPAFLQSVPYPTGLVYIELDQEGVPEYNFTNDTAYDHIPTTENLLNAARKTHVVCFGTLAQRTEDSRKTILTFLNIMPKDQRVRIFDVNLRQNFYNQEILTSSLEHCEVVKCNQEELAILSEFAGLGSCSPQSYYNYVRENYGVSCLIFTEGSLGSTIFLKDEISKLPAPKIDKLVDTVGAGDAFAAACIGALLKGFPLKEAHAFANEVSGFVCSKEGAMPTLPYAFKLR